MRGWGRREYRAGAWALARSVAIDAILAAMWVWETEASDPRLQGPTVVTCVSHRVAGTAICQPTSVATVQAVELPGGKELAHLGDLGIVFLAGLLCLCQCQLLRVLQVVHLPCGMWGVRAGQWSGQLEKTTGPGAMPAHPDPTNQPPKT